ncbi:MAG: cytochrome c [Caldilineaceae bacterium]|nr:cytochrome c [Caldilineaceae bacterium]MBP8107676.1 cytochrome c [Caldilineaceae bacterium]MBP8122902.1 cytochrome c [Caldilineaceae bacterium]MBP9072289.1 cytochrome c [Caldilineaceae bacterium]
MKVSRMLILLVLLGAFFVLAACGGMADGHAMADTSTAEMGEADMHADTTDNDGDQAHDGGEMMDGMMMDHGVPEEAEAVANPIPATEASIAAGAALFQTNCAACHGESGAGDGPAAAALDPKPANLGADHVQANSDGALFYIITHGRTGTAMPPWESVLTEDQRWEVVNFVRTVKE